MADNDDKKKRLISLNENRVRVIGRVYKKPRLSPNEKYVRVPILIPSRRSDGDTQWIPVNIDVVGVKFRERSLGAKPGDYMRASCFLVPNRKESDNGNKVTQLMLQVDTYDAVGITDGQVPESALEKGVYTEPNDDGMCVNEVTVLGRFIARKSAREKGEKGPQVRETNGRKFTFVNIVYNDPRDKEADGTFIDISIFGPQAGIAGDFLKHMDQVYILGELSRRESNYLIKGKKVSEIRISAKPYGFQFVSTRGRQSDDGEPSGPDTSAYEGEGDGSGDNDSFYDEDLPF